MPYWTVIGQMNILLIATQPVNIIGRDGIATLLPHSALRRLA